MRSFKQHISIFLLAGFLFPQGVNSMHYLVVAHNLSFESQTSYSKSDFNFQYHSCQYHLTTFSTLFTSGIGQKSISSVALPVVENFCSLDNYVHQQDYNFQLRGPPYIISTLKPALKNKNCKTHKKQ